MIGFYVHIPFCLSRCHYCDFVSGIASSDPLKKAYVEALIREMRFLSGSYVYRGLLSTLYFGGGTPSLLSLSQLSMLLDELRALYGFSDGLEITLESNPEDVTEDLARGWKEIGINRVSLGFQSMESHILKVLGRRNTPQSNLKAFEILRSAGFKNISLDFILSVSGEHIQEDLKTIQMFQAEHISAYLLSLESGTLLTSRAKSGLYVPMSDVDANRTYREFADVLITEGYEHYEISNFAKPEFYSRHNLNYWDGKEYLAVGIGASGFIKHTQTRGCRWMQTSDLQHYIHTDDFESLYQYRDEIDINTLLKERLMLGLRQIKGINLKKLSLEFDSDLERVFEDIPQHLQKFLISENGLLKLTHRGIEVSNRIIQEVWNIVENRKKE